MKVMRSVIIDAPIETVWQLIRRFDGVDRWNPGVSTASLETGAPTEVGAIRTLEIVDGSVFRETLLAHSDIDRFYTYDILNSPLNCSNYVACHRLVEITEGDKTLGIWEGSFDCDPAEAAELEKIVGDAIYRHAQLAINQYLKENKP